MVTINSNLNSPTVSTPIAQGTVVPSATTTALSSLTIQAIMSPSFTGTVNFILIRPPTTFNYIEPVTGTATSFPYCFNGGSTPVSGPVCSAWSGTNQLTSSARGLFSLIVYAYNAAGVRVDARAIQFWLTTTTATATSTVAVEAPVIWTMNPYPRGGDTRGGNSITLTGEWFNQSTCSQAPIVRFDWSSTGEGTALCVVTSRNRTSVVCTAPEGYGSPKITVSVCSVANLPLPRWPVDVFFNVWNPYTTGDPFPGSPLWCAKTYNNLEPAEHTWNDNWWCAKNFRSKLGLIWSPQGDIPDMKCIAWRNDAEPTWNSTYICWPSQAPYSAVTWEKGSPVGKACAPIREGSDPNWSDGTYYMCAPDGTPYNSDDDLLYRYALPRIDSITPPNGPNTGGTRLTIRGGNFGSGTGVFARGTMTINGRSCDIINSTYNHTYFECISPAGEYKINPVIITVGGQSSLTGNFAYDAPTISSITPPNAPTQGNTLLTILGNNFGANSAGTGQILFSGTSCTISSWNNTAIVFTVPPGQGVDYTIYVAQGPPTDPYLSNPWPFSYAAPSVTSVTPSNGPTRGGTEITIVGTSFGLEGDVVVGSNPCSSPRSRDHSSVICTSPPGQGANQTVNVRQTSSKSAGGFQSSSRQGLFSYFPPTISSITPTAALSKSGQFLTIFGNFFGTPGVATVTIGSLNCDFGVGSSYDHERLICGIPLGSGSDLPVVVNVAEQRSNSTVFSYGPQISSVSVPSTLSNSGGGVIVIYGSGFRNASLSNATITVGGKTATIISRNESIIVVSVPSGEGLDVPVVVTVNGLSSSPFIGINYGGPSISSVANAGGSTNGGTPLTIRGTNFGSNPSVTVKSTQCTITFKNDSLIICTAPAGSGANNPIAVTLPAPDNRKSTESFSFAYNRPNITSISPTSGSGSGGYIVTIFGTDFFNQYGSITVGAKVISPLVQNNTFMTFVMPDGSGIARVSVVVDSQTSPQSVNFQYNPPTIYSVSPRTGPTAGSTQITLVGDSFGTSRLVTVGGAACPILSPPSNSSFVVCLLPAGQGKNREIVLKDSDTGISSPLVSGVTYFDYFAPSITSVQPTTGNTQGGYLVTINGANFGSLAAETTVTIGGRTCDLTATQSGASVRDSQILCVMPPGEGASQTISVTVSTQPAPTPVPAVLFSYSAPQIQTISPTTLSTRGGSVLTVTGSNFGTGASGGNPARVFFTSTNPDPNVGGRYQAECNQTTDSVQSHDKIFCVIPPGQGSDISVTVSVAGQQSSSTRFSYIAPSVGSVSPLPPPTSGGSLTLTGDNFGLGASGFLGFGIQLNQQNLTSLVTSYNSTMVVIALPAGTGASKNLTFTVGGQPARFSATQSTLFSLSYAAPTVTQVTGCTDDVAAKTTSACSVFGQNITITGTNFGNSASPITVSIGPVVDSNVYRTCTNVRIVTAHTKIACTIPEWPEGGTSLSVQAIVDSQLSASFPSISFTGPTISPNTLVLSPSAVTASTGFVNLAVKPNDTSSQGVKVRFAGLNFGNNETTIKITYGIAGSGPYSDAFNCPVVSGSLSNLDATQQQIECIVGPGFGKDLVFRVTVGLLKGPQGQDKLTYLPPTITPNTIRATLNEAGRTVLTGKFSAGDTIFFNVDNIGIPSQGQYLSVFYGRPSQPKSLQCTGVTVPAEGVVSCTTRPGTGTGYVFELREFVDNYISAEGTDIYNYVTPPLVTRVSGAPTCSDVGNTTMSCPTTGGFTITVFGAFFDPVGISCQIGTYSCASISSVVDSSFKCVVPAGTGTNLPVTVTVGTTFSQPFAGLSFSAATITRVTGCTATADGINTQNCPRAGDTSITITGNNFGPPSALVLIGGSVCSSLAHAANSVHSVVTCRTPAGNKQDRKIIFIQSGGGQITASNVSVSYKQCDPGSYSAADETTCTLCPAGRYSDGFGATECKACGSGFFSNATGLTSCTGCAPGSYSAISSDGSANCSLCSPGYYQPLAAQDRCLPCDAGKYTNTYGRTDCDPCEAGSANRFTAQTICQPCISGFFSLSGQVQCDKCPAGTRASTTQGASSCIDCATGTSSVATTEPLDGQTTCYPCALGRYANAAGQAKCIACQSGSYANSTGLTDCYRCAAGSFSQLTLDSGAVSCAPCTTGRYMDAAGQSFCLQCNPGSYSSTSGSVTCTKCELGKQNPSFGQPSCTECEVGQYADATGTLSCKDCPVGTFSNRTGLSQCTSCGFGFAQPSTKQTICQPCTTGKYTESEEQASCSSCDSGFFASTTGLRQCSACPAGEISKFTSSSSCSVCQPGTYFPNTKGTTCLDCPIGQFSNITGAIACQLCPPGTAQPITGQRKCNNCTTGSYSPESGAFSCLLCPLGRYQSQEGQTTCLPCARGQYQSSTGQSRCLDCTGNTVTFAEGQASCTLCPAGKYAADSKTCVDCAAGSARSSSESTCNPCIAGTYQDSPGQARCLECDPGYYVPPTNLSAANPFSLSVAPSARGCIKCSTGSYSNGGASACVACAAGFYADTQGQAVCLQCPPGSFSDGTGASSCKACDPGYNAADAGRIICSECEVGKYTNIKGSVTCLSCPSGTFLDRTKQTICSECSVGYSQPLTGQTACSSCGPGSYSDSIRSKSCKPCQLGRFHNESSRTTCDLCPIGKFMNETGGVACFDCPLGTYSANNGSAACIPCAPGSYINSTGATVCSLCPAGTSQPLSGRTSCVACAPGFAISQLGQAICRECPVGYFSDVSGQTNCSACPVRTYQGDSGKSACNLCPPGSSGPQEAMEICTACAQGFYSAVFGAQQCTPCSTGTTTSGANSTTCDVCTAGKYNPGQAGTNCLQCKEGTFSNTSGAIACTPCSAGTSQKSREQTTCELCAKGRFSDAQGALDCKNCGVGFFSNGLGSIECNKCPVGTYIDITGQTACLPCPAGTFSSQEGAAFCRPCDPGTYSPGGVLSSCFNCPPGSFQSNAGQSSCLPCEAGNYADYPGGYRICDLCPVGKATNFTNTTVCPDCKAGYYQPSRGGFKCLACPAGKTSDDGQSACTSCSGNTVTWMDGMSRCVTCNDKNARAVPENNDCFCLTGYFKPKLGDPTVDDPISCLKCPNGANCERNGTTEVTLEALPGWWRAGNQTRSFYRCQFLEFCPGGVGSFASGVSRCTDHRTGPVCGICEKGYYETAGGQCIACPDQQGDLAYVYYVFIAILIGLILWIMFYIVIRSGAYLLLSVIAPGDDAPKAEIDHFASDVSVRPEDLPSEHALQTKQAMYGAVVEMEPLEDEAPVQELAMHGTQPWAQQPAFLDPRNKKILTINGPPTPRSMFTYKLKILISFIQICTNVGGNLELQWPSKFKSFVLWFDIANFDFILTQVSSAECIDSFDYYRKFVIIVCFPVVVFLLVAIIYLLPRYFRMACFRNYDNTAALRAKVNFWKMTLFLMFLIYPGVSSTILRLYLCKHFDGLNGDWLLADLRVECFTVTWIIFALNGIYLIIIYPLGIPAFFFYLLWSNRTKLHDDRIKAKIGILYAGYRLSAWWFEMIDLMHKLFLTSIIAFFPVGGQLPLGMCIACFYLIVILRTNPYLRADDDKLHLLAQTEIFLLFFAGWIFYDDPLSASDDTNDWLLSFLLIFVVCILFVVFLYYAFKVIRHWYRNRKKESAKEKPEDEEVFEHSRRHSLMLREREEAFFANQKPSEYIHV